MSRIAILGSCLALGWTVTLPAQVAPDVGVNVAAPAVRGAAAPVLPPVPAGIRLLPSPLLAVDQNRLSIIEGIVDNWKASLAQAYGTGAPAREEELRLALMGLRADRLLSASLAGTVDGLGRTLAAEDFPPVVDQPPGGGVGKALGDSALDLVYTPVTPCRIVDTRNGATPFNVPLAGPTIRTVTANLPNFLLQGGAPNDCGLPPTGTAALAVVFTVLNPNYDAYLAAGNTTVYADLSRAVVMNFSSNRGLANTVIVPLDVSVPAIPRFHLTLPDQVSTHLLADAVGYFRAPSGVVGDITAVTAGTGLTGGSASGSAALSLAAGYQLPQGCGNGQVPKSNGAGTWTCQADLNSGGTVSLVGTGSGLTGGPITGTGTIALAATQLLPAVACGSSQIAKWSGSAWACATDNDTNDTANDARYFRQGGSAFAGPAVLGTTNNNALEFRVAGARVVRYEPDMISPNVIGGNPNNAVSPGVRGATIGGGGVASGDSDPSYTGEAPNQVTDHYGTVGGGYANVAGSNDGNLGGSAFATVGGGVGNTGSGPFSTVSGGQGNTASGQRSTVGGGQSNVAGEYSTVGGGLSNSANAYVGTIAGGLGNTASNNYSTVVGGLSNTASGLLSTVGGGTQNTASGAWSFAVGRRAKTHTVGLTPHDGAFVWADANNVDFYSVATNEFAARATGGVRFVTSISGSGAPANSVRFDTSGNVIATGTFNPPSDVTMKTAFGELAVRDVLKRVLELPVRSWVFRSVPEVRHIGPSAQDFHAAFGVGLDDKHIATVDADGVALAAIQGLHQVVQEKDRSIAAQSRRIAQLDRKATKLQKELEELRRLVNSLAPRAATR